MTIKNDLYFLREPRTGGTLFESLIRHKVGDKFTCFTHHQIEFIKNIPVNPNTVILRSARKNLVEHFLSIRFLQDFPKTTRFTNFTLDNPTDVLFSKMIGQKITISKIEVTDWLDAKIQNEFIFNDLVKNFQHQTVYYEDMGKPTHMPILGLQHIVFFDYKEYTIKLPDYKKEVFTNYDQVVKWMEGSLNALTKKYNAKELFKHWSSHSSS